MSHPTDQLSQSSYSKLAGSYCYLRHPQTYCFCISLYIHVTSAFLQSAIISATSSSLLSVVNILL
ncbi:unnamed protein product [Hymenolepis diminuta]|uniref:Uncharacterized protein n=1 Tax=Hymenolepis diminuta TaxID=6216 RepID=A0A564Z024_HYMDI|nr:unnamed protein product [Hymenolepis diminuta]